MIESFLTGSSWGGGAFAFGADVAIKATVFLLLAIGLDRILLRRWVLIRSAMWNACLIALLLLPVATAAFPRFRIPCLPPRSVIAVVVPQTPQVLPAGRPVEHQPVRATGPSLFLTAAELYERVVVLSPPARTGTRAAPVAGPACRLLPEEAFSDGLRPPPAAVTAAASPAKDGEGGTGTPEKVPPVRKARWKAKVNGYSLVGLIYLAGVGLLVARLVCSLIAVEMLKRSGACVMDPAWLAGSARWQGRLGVRRPVRLSRTERISVPTSVGWIAPAILLPISPGERFSESARDAILLHELAHIRRRDYLWQVLLRIVQAVYWPHPLVWVIGRLLASTREQACDDLCVHHLSGSGSYRSALIDVAEALGRRPRLRPGYVGMPMARSAGLARRLRQIDGSRGLRRCLAGWRVRAGIALFATLGAGIIAPMELTRRTAQAEQFKVSASQPTGSQPSAATSGPTTTRSATTNEAWSAGRTLDFRVVHAGTGAPLPDVRIHVSIDRTDLEGKTDAEGRFNIKLPDKEPWEVIVNARRPRFVSMGVYFRGFSKRFDVPDRYTLKMWPGTSIGGIVRDESGKPIEGAKVQVNLHSEGMEHVCITDQEERTDAQGRWQCDVVPEDIEGIRLAVRHPDYVGDGSVYERPAPPIDKLRAKSFVVVMKRGLAISGTVLSREGKPIKDAYVLLGREAEVDELPQTRTDAEGRFHLGCAKAGDTYLTIYAPGFAPEQRPLKVVADPVRVAFRLGPPRTIRGRVVDSKGRPIAQAVANPTLWRGLSFHEFKLRTDAEGRFRWDNAPPDAVGFHISKDGYQTLRDVWLAPSDTEHVIKLATTAIVRGTVVDAQTGARIPEFDVTRSQQTIAGGYSWNTYTRKTFGSGRYKVSFDEIAPEYQIRVEADGYEPAVSAKFKPAEGEQVFDFGLRKATVTAGVPPVRRTVIGRIVSPAGSNRTIDWKGDQRARLVRYDNEQPKKRRSGLGEMLRSATRGSAPTDRKAGSEPPKNYEYKVGPDGSFRVNDVFPGHYHLYVDLYQPRRWTHPAEREQVGELHHEFDVPEAARSGDDAPADLGALEFVFRKELKVGNPAPLFDLPITQGSLRQRVASGRRVRLADLVGRTGTGRFVLLTFWDGGDLPWFNAQREYFKSVYETYRDDERLIMIFLCRYFCDSALEAMLGKDNPKAVQTVLDHTGPKLLRDYGIMGTSRDRPEVFLIGPEGTILARDLRGAGGDSFMTESGGVDIKEALARALGPPGRRETPGATQPATAPDGSRILDFRAVDRRSKAPLPGVRLTIVGGEPRSATTDNQGRCEVRLDPKKTLFLFVTAEKDGFVPVRVEWANGRLFAEGPRTYALALEPAVPIGGIVKDPSGKPMPDIRVTLNLRRMDAEAGASAKVWIPDVIVRTDAHGRWSYPSAPARLDGLTVRLSHPAYREVELGGGGFPPPDAPGGRTAVSVLKPKGEGFPIMGTVRDDHGKPIAWASLTVVRPEQEELTLELLGRRNAHTDAEGRYCVYCPKAGNVVLIARARKRAPGMQRVTVGPATPPVDFRLGPGHTIRGRVVNKQGKPIEEFDLYPSSWRGVEFNLAQLYTDGNGRFMWQEAPPDEVEFTFSGGAEYVYQKKVLAPSNTEYVITVYRPTHVSGKVLDAQTGRPISDFKLLPHAESLEEEVNTAMWKLERKVKVEPGRYDLRTETSVLSSKEFRFRIEAEGYRPFVSRPFVIEDEEVTYDIRLQKGEWLKGVVRSQAGQPLASAIVVLADPNCPVFLENRKLSHFSPGARAAGSTDILGRFSICPPLKPSALLVLHEQGYAMMPLDPSGSIPEVKVQPWGRVEGTVRVGTKPAAQTEVKVVGQKDRTEGLPMIRHECTGSTDSEGRFVIERVFPGDGRIGYMLKDVDSDSHNTAVLSIRIASGETARISFGGMGRPVVGRITLPPGVSADKGIKWNSQHNRLVLVQPRPPMPETVRRKGLDAQDVWRRTWLASAEGKAWVAASRRYAVLVKPDGTFRAEDVPAGSYELDLYVHKKVKSWLVEEGEQIGSLHRTVVVPEMPGGRSDEPLDLGTLSLQPTRLLKPGEVAPTFEVQTADGKRMKLSDFRGKFVLLFFYAFAPMEAEKSLNRLAAEFAGEGRFAMLGVNIMALGIEDEDESETFNRLLVADKLMCDLLHEGGRSEQLRWVRTVAEWDTARTLQESYGLARDPSCWLEFPPTFLIGPDGKIVAARLKASELESAVRNALGG